VDSTVVLNVTSLAVSTILSFVIIIAGISLYRLLNKEDNGYIYEDEIEAALLPIIYQAIGAAYKTSEKAIDEIQERLDGVDKKKIADAVYEILPDYVGPFPLAIVKAIVSQSKFEVLVDLAFNGIDNLIEKNQTHFDDLYQEWVDESK